MVWFLRFVLLLNGLILLALGCGIFMASALQQTYFIWIPLPQPEVYGHLLGISWVSLAWLLLHAAITKHSAMIVARKFGYMNVIASVFIAYFAYNHHSSLSSQNGAIVVAACAGVVFLLGALEIWLMGLIKTNALKQSYAEKVLSKNLPQDATSTVSKSPETKNLQTTSTSNNSSPAVAPPTNDKATAPNLSNETLSQLGDGTADISAINEKKTGWLKR